MYERAVEISEKALGPEHPTVATVLNEQAWLLRRQVNALQIFQQLPCAQGGRMKPLEEVLVVGLLLLNNGRVVDSEGEGRQNC